MFQNFEYLFECQRLFLVFQAQVVYRSPSISDYIYILFTSFTFRNLVSSIFTNTENNKIYILYSNYGILILPISSEFIWAHFHSLFRIYLDAFFLSVQN